MDNIVGVKYETNEKVENYYPPFHDTQEDLQYIGYTIIHIVVEYDPAPIDPNPWVQEELMLQPLR